MEHEYFKDRISAYFDRELKHEEEQMIAEHLQSCEQCQKLYAELEKLESLVEEKSGLKDDEYWETQAQKIEKLIYPEEKSKVVEIKQSQWRGLGWKVSSLVAVAAAVVFIAVNYQDIQREIPIEKTPSSVTIPSPPQPKPGVDNIKEETKDAPDAIGISVDSIDLDSGIRIRIIDTDMETADKEDKPARKIEAPPERITEEPARGKQPESEKPEIGVPAPVSDAEKTRSGQKDSVLLKEEIKAKPVVEFDELADISQPGDAEDVAVEIESKPTSPLPVMSTDEAKTSAEKARESFSTGMSFEGGADLKVAPDSTGEKALAEWLIRRDSLLDAANQPAKKSSFTKIQGIASSQTEETEKEKLYYSDTIEKELLKCNYNIALLSEDRSEYLKAYDFIEKRTVDENYRLKEEALEYLKKLDENK